MVKMIKYLPLILLVLMHGGIAARVLTVGQAGEQQYSGIQVAINASTHGDTILVSPGEYMEHLDTLGKNISIRSHYYLTQAPETIDNTIIHASLPNSCLSIQNYETVSLDGFTLMNNSLEVLDYPYVGATNLRAGGIGVYGSASVQISNCVIRNCYGQKAGGIYFEGKNFSLSNTRIFDNYSMDGPGGLFISGWLAGSIVFDNRHPNSIFDNTGPLGMDICIGNLHQPIDLMLDTGSVILTEPDWFWIWYDQSMDVNLTVRNAYIDLVDSDIWVSWVGDDNNSGLTPQAPLKTVAKAAKIIKPNSARRNTIHVAEGVYNFSDSDQFFPLSLKSHTRLVGAYPEVVVFDMETTMRPTFRLTMRKNVTIENITFIPHIHWVDNRFPVEAILCESIEFRNLHWFGDTESVNRDHTRISIFKCDGVICENISAQNATTSDQYNLAVLVQYSKNVFLNNILINNLTSLDDGFHSGIHIYESDGTVRNVIISNSYAYTGTMFSFYNWVNPGLSLDLSNMLFINNTSRSADLGGPIYIRSDFERAQIRNSTFANNNAWGRKVMLLRGYGDIYNCIFYNPDNYWVDLLVSNLHYGNSYDSSVSHSLFTVPFLVADSTAASLHNNLIGIDPLFADQNLPHWDPSQAHSYHLSADSPCVDAGTPFPVGLNLPAMDLAGNYRIWGSGVDMGCYEYGSEPYVSVHDPQTPPPPEKITMSLYPNPVRINNLRAGYMFIEFSIPKVTAEEPHIHIYNLKGQKIKTLHAARSYGQRKIGEDKSGDGGGVFYSTVYDCSDQFSRKLSSGIYLIRVEAGALKATAKLTIVK
jgi:hypothetical protein